MKTEYHSTKNYYSLKELSPIVNLTYRQLQKRIKTLNLEAIDKNLIYKKNNKWNIHQSLINQFKRKKQPINYKLFVTIASKNQFDVNYWRYLITNQLYKLLKTYDKTTRIKYVIEKTSNGIYHLHFITTFSSTKELRAILHNNIYTDNTNDMNINIKNIVIIKGLHSYFRKQNKPILLK